MERSSILGGLPSLLHVGFGDDAGAVAVVAGDEQAFLGADVNVAAGRDLLEGTVGHAEFFLTDGFGDALEGEGVFAFLVFQHCRHTR